jgi:predicted acetyltransferase
MRKSAMEIRGMRPDELSDVHAMLDRAFPNTPGSFFTKQVKNDPGLRPQDTRILLEDGLVRSCVRIYYRTIYCNGETLRVGGIGDVGTDPDYQGRGYATLLINDAISHMKENGAAVSFLFTKINSFYEKAGYFTLPTYDLTLEPALPGEPVSHRPVNLDRDMEFLDTVYKNMNSDRVGPVVRNGKYWKCQMGFPRVDPELTWVHERLGRPVCYARGFLLEDNLKLLEYGFANREENSLFQLIATMTAKLNKKKILLSYLSKKEVALFTQWPSTVQENTALMVRILQPENLSSLRAIFIPHHILFWESDRF